MDHARFDSHGWGVFLCTLLAASSLSEATCAAELSAEQIARELAQVTRIQTGTVTVSPDGKWVTYQVLRRPLEHNEEIEETRLQRTDHVGQAGSAKTVLLPPGARHVRWRPGSNELSMWLPVSAGGLEGWVLYNPVSAKLSPIHVGTNANGASQDDGNRSLVPTYGYHWSPKGNFIAFAAQLQKPVDGSLDRRRGVPADRWQKAGRARFALVILNIEEGSLTQITDDTVNVGARIAWSPDETALALPVKNANGDTDVVIIDRVHRSIRPLVTREGDDTNPIWSPDGKWIAFVADGWPAVVPASGGEATTLGDHKIPRTSALDWWSTDSRAFFYESYWEMTKRLVRVDLKTGHVALVADNAPDFTDTRYISANGRDLAYVRESLTLPPELWMRTIHGTGKPTNQPPRKLTSLSTRFDLGNEVRVEMLNWISRDRKFVIGGLLLAPNDPRNGHAANLPLPLIVYHNGGPQPFGTEFSQDGSYGLPLALAIRGYAVLLPSGRGRPGRGEALRNAVRDEKIRFAGAHEDALAGVDLLIERGIADPEQLGVAGHSYGGQLAAFAITQTQRFKAAVIHEGSVDSAINPEVFGIEPGSEGELLLRNGYGIYNPFDLQERTRLFAESPLVNADRVRTPTLLQYGRNVLRSGLPFYHALRRFDVPAAIFAYDEGHGFIRPAATADDLTRSVEWLDYWVRGIPFPNEERAREYQMWKNVK